MPQAASPPIPPHGRLWRPFTPPCKSHRTLHVADICGPVYDAMGTESKHCDHEMALLGLQDTAGHMQLSFEGEPPRQCRQGKSCPPTSRMPSAGSMGSANPFATCPTPSMCLAPLCTTSSAGGGPQGRPPIPGELATHRSSRGGPRSSCRGQRQSILWQHAKTSRTVWASQDEASHCPPSPGH